MILRTILAGLALAEKAADLWNAHSDNERLKAELEVERKRRIAADDAKNRAELDAEAMRLVAKERRE